MMNLQDLPKILSRHKTLSIEGGQVRVDSERLDQSLQVDVLVSLYGDAGVVITEAEASADGGKVIVTGKTSFPSLTAPADGLANPLLAQPVKVLVLFELIDAGQVLRATLRYELSPKDWSFATSFPELPTPFDPDGKQSHSGKKKPELDTVFPLKGDQNQYFYITTHDYEHTPESDISKLLEADCRIPLKKGMNFVRLRTVPQGLLGLLAIPAGDKALLLHGQVIPNPVSDLPTVQGYTLPWNTWPRIPGIHLTVPIGAGISFPPESKAMQFTNLRLALYSPLSEFWLQENSSYRAAMAFLGDIVIPSIRKTRLLTVSAAIRSGRENELTFACDFIDCSMKELMDTSTALVDGKSLASFMPSKFVDVLGDLGPQSASLTLSRTSAESNYEVTCTQLTIGMTSEKWWEPFGPFFKIGFDSVRMAVLYPFESEQQSWFATFRGRIEFFNVKFNVTLEAPNLYLSARQSESTTFNLKEYFANECKLRWPKFLPPTVKLSDMTLEADSGKYYAFSMSLGTDYKIKDDGPGRDKNLPIKEYSLPTLGFSLSYAKLTEDTTDWRWQFKASTDADKEAVPLFVLIEKLADGVGVGISLPAAVRNLITVQRVAVSYGSHSGHFAFECSGKLRFNTISLDCGFTIKHILARTGPPAVESTTIFGGQIRLAPEAGRGPLSFNLCFATDGNSKSGLAAYHDQYGYELKIRSLAECVFDKEYSDLIPESLEISLKSAFIAYSQEDQKTDGAIEPAANSAALFGADLGAKIKLSDLPVVGDALPKGLEIGFDSLRVLLASASFSEKAVQKMNGLMPDGMTRIPDGSQRSNGAPGEATLKHALDKGFNISASLLFAGAPRTLTLPVMGAGEETSAGAGNESTPSTPSQPGDKPATTPAVAATTKWFDIDKSLGPLTVRRVGLDYEAPRVGIKFDASLQLSILTFNLEGLGLTYKLGGSTEPLEILKNIDFTLDGMGLSLGNGPVEIGGSLARISRSNEPLALEGSLLIRTVPFTFSALGSYTDLNGTISVTAFAVLLAELGDPTGTGAFVVMGLAFGFGINRKLTLPRIEDVHTFPLVQAAMVGKQDLKTVSALPTKLRDHVAPSVGNFWVAAGIKFNSFGMVDSFLLLTVSWGAEIEIGLLGLSRMTVPPMVQPEESIAGAELSLRGVIRIVEGLIQFEARLTDNSFIFAKNCRLTGGFAFCLWFKGSHSGDFVLSLGGYHPAFLRPTHYPLVPRLGMQLQIGKELSITGEAYFALTPFCVMAGGKLSAVYKSGGIEAWFIAYADFLMNWQPFYYQAVIGITLGIALRLGAIAIRLELSVDLRLQGPPFGGEARVRLWIISFTIPFGKPSSGPLPLTARRFAATCLPAPKLPAKDESPDVLSVRITDGLLAEHEMKDGSPVRRIVAAHRLSLVAQSAIPCTDFDGLAPVHTTKSECGILPMGRTTLKSVFTVVADGIKPANVRVTAVLGKVPKAMWGRAHTELSVPAPKLPKTDTSDEGTIEVMLGIRITCIQRKPAHEVPAIEIQQFKRGDEKKVDWGHAAAGAARAISRGGRTIFNTIESAAVVQRRKEVLTCIQKHLPSNFKLNEPSLVMLEANPDYFQVPEPEMVATYE